MFQGTNQNQMRLWILLWQLGPYYLTHSNQLYTHFTYIPSQYIPVSTIKTKAFS